MKNTIQLNDPSVSDLSGRCRGLSCILLRVSLRVISFLGNAGRTFTEGLAERCFLLFETQLCSVSGSVRRDLTDEQP